MLSSELEFCLNDAFHQARQARHEHLTVEHLLLAIIDSEKVREVLRACGADPDRLKQELKDHIDQSTPRLEAGEEREVQPTLGFQRILQRAVFHVQSSGKKEVGVTNVLVAVFTEKDSHAVLLLARQNVTRAHIVNYIAHGMRKVAEAQSVRTELPDAGPRIEDAEDPARLLDAVLAQGVKDRASHIHIEPFVSELVIRFRVHGVLREVLRYPRVLHDRLLACIKALAGLDITESKQPQDSRIRMSIAGGDHDVHVATFPSIHGERAVLHLLEAAGRDFVTLGMDPETAWRLDELLHRPRGLLLVTGPAGSGRTLTLYAALERLADGSRNIMTLEDPIDHPLEGISQSQPGSGPRMSAEGVLRALLHQDPDVIMLDCLRDATTAQLVIEASFTRQLVLAKLDASTTAGAITRLKGLGITPPRLASSLLGVLAQRQVRVLDPATRQAFEAGPPERDFLGLAADAPSPLLYRPGDGPSAGYIGRTCLYELMAVDATLHRLISTGASEQALKEHASRITPSLRDDARAKVASGMTTIEEVSSALRDT